MKRGIAVAITILMIAGCASYRPIVDMQGVDPYLYEMDLRECQQYAEQIDTSSEVVGSTAVGTVFGAAIGIAGGGRSSLGTGAAVGAVTGVAAGGAKASRDKNQVIRNCLTGRGYRVLR